MSVHVMSQVWQKSDEKANRLLLLLALADIADDNGWAFPSQAMLAKKCRIGRRAVQKLLDALEAQGEIVIYNRVSEKAFDQHFSNVYHLRKYAQYPDAPAPEDLRGALRLRSWGGEQPDTTVVNSETLPSDPPDTTVVNSDSLGSEQPDTGVANSGSHDPLLNTSLDPSVVNPLPEPPRAGAHDGGIAQSVVVVDPDDQSHWDAAFHQLEMQLDTASFGAFLTGARLLKVERVEATDTLTPLPPAPVFVIGVRSSYAQEMLQHRLYRNVRRVLSDVSGGVKELRFEIDIAPKPVEDADCGEIPLWRKLARDAEATDFGYETMTVRGVFEREFGVITDEREAAVERLETYGVKAFGEALEILKNRKARGAVSDPLGFVLGVLSNRKANVRT